MLSTIGDLCDTALEYLLTVPIGNHYKRYVPTGTLRNGGTLKNWTYHIRVPAYNTHVDTTASVSVYTSESIPEKYLAKVTDSKITEDWNSYKKNYIYPKVPANTYISTSSMFGFIYLFRYFVDKHLKMFTDIYGKSYVWLYDTENVTYSPTDIKMTQDKTDVSTIEKYVDTLIDEVVTRDTIQTLHASTSFNSCSSSSSSSSCSSSSSSSSCSSSSSSSSSLFIAYFNLG
jgi:hypothetical protein